MPIVADRRQIRSRADNKTHLLRDSEEGEKGTLTPGKWADVKVLSQNILTVDEGAIPDTRVEITIVGGEVVYRAGGGENGGMR